MNEVKAKVEMWVVKLHFDQNNPPLTGQTDYIYAFKFEPSDNILFRKVNCQYNLIHNKIVISSIEANFDITLDETPKLDTKHPELLVMAKIAFRYTQNEYIRTLASKGVQISLSFPTDEDILGAINNALKAANLQ